MLRKMTAMLISLLLLSCLAIPTFAQSNTYIIDDAGLLRPEEISVLEEKAEELETRYQIQAVVLTVHSLNDSRAQDYADNYYDQSGYGENGILFLLAMAEREWYISTSGSVIYALTDYGIQQIGEEVASFLAEEQWFAGFNAFMDAIPPYLDAFENGSPVDGYADYSGDYYHGDQKEIVHYEEDFSPSFFISVLCGVVVSGIVLLIMRLSMNSKRSQRCASAYMEDGSWNLTQHQDIFLYSNITKTRKEETSKSSGGGSSVHRSSGGRSHGGGGGKF